MKYCLIRQPAGLGDIFFCQKIAKKIIEKHNWDIVWPIADVFKYLPTYIPNDRINYCSINSNFPNKEYFTFRNISVNVNNDEFMYLPIQDASTILGKPENILRAKYEMIGLDCNDWADYFTFTRQIERENKLYYEWLGLKDNEEYVLVNNTFASPPNTETISIPLTHEKRKVVLMKFFPDDNLFDWCKVIEKASAIHTVQTSLNYMAEKLTLKTDELFIYQRPGWKNFDYIEGIFKQKWNYRQ
jgi:hypothetical protein